MNPQSRTWWRLAVFFFFFLFSLSNGQTRKCRYPLQSWNVISSVPSQVDKAEKLFFFWVKSSTTSVRSVIPSFYFYYYYFLKFCSSKTFAPVSHGRFCLVWVQPTLDLLARPHLKVFEHAVHFCATCIIEALQKHTVGLKYEIKRWAFLLKSKASWGSSVFYSGSLEGRSKCFKDCSQEWAPLPVMSSRISF